MDVQKSKENHVVSKPVTLQTSPAKQRGVNSNKNVIAPGMYKVVTTHESQTNEAKHDLSSTRMNAASSVRRPMNRDSHVKNSVLANSKKPTKKVAVYVRKNKQTDNTSENVISNKENVMMCGNKSILRVLRIILVILPEHPSETIVFHNEDGNPARANIKQALGYLKDGDGDGNSQPHKGVKASANSDVMYSFTSAQDGDPLQDDVRLCLGDDLKKAQDHSQRQAIYHNLVYGLPKFKYGKDHLCSACERGKSKKASHPLKLVPSDHSKLELLHMDLCGPMRVASINRKKYILGIVDNYSRYTWVYFLHSKDETPEIIKKFIAQAQLNYKAKVCKIRTDNGTEFKNATLKAHYEKLGIMQQFSTARTPQQNGVVKRRNRTLVESARSMLIFSRLPKFLWAEAVATACFTQNRSIIHTRHNKTPYELLRGRKPNVEYFHVFGSLCYPTNNEDDLVKMKPKADIEVFIGYSETSRGFRIYNRRTKKIMETINVKFDELTTMASEHDCLEPELQ
ncbi:retrovirus-related pol polyprotein from transposon TNT 1-94 [Tanacetum coccineum]|uniref:Retrovirus-related pol polyprotein from transposon TNT 1-94 n=1 Tax=Tanacetum coccineum TaxID=301880 RepID=A0ABQ5I904_9ASTR